MTERGARLLRTDRPGLRWGPTRVPARPGEAQPVRRVILLMGSLSGYAGLLHWTYQNRISPVFSSLGLRYRDPEPGFYAIAFVLMVLVGCLLPTRLRKPSDFILWVLYVMTCAPSILVPQYAAVLTPAASTELAAAAAASFALVILLTKVGPGLKIPRILIPEHLLWITLALVTVFVYIYMVYVTGISIQAMGLTEVRSTRFAYHDAIQASGAGLAYFLGIQGNVINPVFMVRGMYSGNLLMTTAGAIGQVIIYSETGYKMVLLSVPTALIVPLMFRRSETPLGRSILTGTILAGLVALLADRIAGACEYTLVFIGRLALIPGVLTAAHVLVFEKREKALWGHSFLAPFVDYPYPTSPAMMVGAEFSGESRTTANASFIADGYANLGYPGVFLEAIVLVLLLWALDAAAKGIPMKVSCVILLIPSIALVNTSVFTSMVTGGCLFAIVILTVLPRAGWGRNRQSHGQSTSGWNRP